MLTISRIMLPQICALSHACLKQTHYLLNGLEVDDAAMKRNLALSKGAVVSEAVMMGLGKTIGRQKAHDIVYEYVLLFAVAPVEPKTDRSITVYVAKPSSKTRRYWICCVPTKRSRRRDYRTRNCKRFVILSTTWV